MLISVSSERRIGHSHCTLPNHTTLATLGYSPLGSTIFEEWVGGIFFGSKDRVESVELVVEVREALLWVAWLE